MIESEADAKQELKVEQRVGEIPRLWNRKVVFVANLLSLFFGNRRETEVLREKVGALETYGGRLIPIVDLMYKSGENLLILEALPDPRLCDYFEKGLGLSLPTVEVASHHAYLSVLQSEEERGDPGRKFIEAVRNHPAEWLDAYVTDEALIRLAELTGKKVMTRRESSRQGNNKFLLHHFLEEKGLPVFDTEVAASPDEVPACIARLKERGYGRGVIKAQVGASGIGLVKLDFSRNEPAPEYLFHEGPCLVQGWLEAGPGMDYLGSPSVQLCVRDEVVELYDMTDQILSGASVHEGNAAPPEFLGTHPEIADELLRQAEVAGRWLHGSGFRGTGSVDFHVVIRRGTPEVRVCEINARVTGATYPSLLARTFRPGGAWLMRNIRFTSPYASSHILDALDQACLLFKKGMESGVVPINFNLTRDGYVNKGQFLAIGKDGAEVRELFRAVRNLEVILWEYDRD